MDDLDLVEGVAETVGGSVQLQLARRLESVRSLGGPLLGSRLPRGSRSVLVVVVLRSDRSWRRGWLVVVVLDRSWRRCRSWSLTRVLLAERWVVPARIVLSIVVSLVVVATSTSAELRLVLRLLLVLGLRLVLRLLRLWRSMWWRSWRNWQMVSRGLESILASDVGDGSSLSGRVKVAVGSATVTIGIRFLLEVGSVFLIVRSTELAITGKVALFAQDRRRLRVTVVVALVLRGRGHQQR